MVAEPLFQKTGSMELCRTVAYRRNVKILAKVDNKGKGERSYTDHMGGSVNVRLWTVLNAKTAPFSVVL